MNIIIGQCATVLQLLARKDQSLLIWWNAFLVLNLCFDIFDSIRSLHFECYGFTRQSLYKNLHSSAQSKHQMQSRFLLDVIIRKRATIFQLLS
ncbi:unnamed protein product [Brugia timori]|uniref:Uncharacterized protein n=1 Tax=Brugia timori TaxID=42155 RepID=A0A3P7WPW9_9BILA|nr:unnamed protein product [Brugia timori]